MMGCGEGLVTHLGVVKAVHDEHEIEGGDVADLVEAPRDPRLQRQARCRRSLCQVRTEF